MLISKIDSTLFKDSILNQNYTPNCFDEFNQTELFKKYGTNNFYKKHAPIKSVPKNPNPKTIPPKPKPVPKKPVSPQNKPVKTGQQPANKKIFPAKLSVNMPIMFLDSAINLTALFGGISYIQTFVNGEVLGKLLKHFNLKINDNAKLVELAGKMRQNYGLQDTVKIMYGLPGEAYFTTHPKQHIVIGKDSHFALFHELGHAVIENKTKFLKELQHERNNYGTISTFLYLLLSLHKKQYYSAKPQSQNSWKDKILRNYDLIIPMLAYSPELITEIGASSYGLKFLKKEAKDGNLTKKILSNIRKCYITAFSTYLFIPMSLILYIATDKKKLTPEQIAKNTILSTGLGLLGGLITANSELNKRKVLQNGEYTSEYLEKVLYTALLNAGDNTNSYPDDILSHLVQLYEAKQLNTSNLSPDAAKLVKNAQDNLISDIDKVFDRKTGKFKNANSIDKNYIMFQKDIKTAFKNFRIKPVIKAAFSAGFGLTLLTYMLGKILRHNGNRKKPKKSNQIKKTPVK